MKENYTKSSLNRILKGRRNVVIGLEFGGLENDGRTGWVRIQTPLWDDDIITPGLVKNIIEWSLMDKENLILVDWAGNEICMG